MIYNFLQTYLPEKKYSIVEALEKETIIRQSTDLIENGSLLKTDVNTANTANHISDSNTSNSMEDFKIKIEKLKMMKDAGLLSDEKFEEEQAKLLELI